MAIAAIVTTETATRPSVAVNAISLDDVSWDDVASRVSSASYNQLNNLQAILTKTSNELQWKQVFSEEWFLTIQTTAHDLLLLYAASPILFKVVSVAFPLLLVTTAALYQLSMPQPDYRLGMEPYPRGVYDPVAAQAYYRKHKILTAQRILELLRLSNRFLLNLAVDKYVFPKRQQQHQRAQELLALITELGPTAIKVGQALSVRPDLVPPEYASALATLQDRVPPFSNAQAKELLRTELGVEKLNQLGIPLEGSKSRPVASASIGQVYRGTLSGLDKNVDVAVKVQRPNVLAEIALDLYIVREIAAPLYQAFTRGATDLQGLASEWGRGFIGELDYRQEAADTIQFNREMEQRQLNAVMAPVVVTEYCTEQILVTEWVDGTRLDESDADDVPRLCSVALNAYLLMLLETRKLHCDPHPVGIR
jgi:ABC1 atypical kinase-like domain